VNRGVDLNLKLENLPDKPGCYLFKDKDKRIIYIGKAASLTKRVRSYFQKARQDAKTERLIARIADLEVLVTASEKDALLLESNLIKEHRPRYNIDLKDDKRYPYIKITTNETYPRMLVVRRMVKDGARYFGPYTRVTSMRKTLKLIRRIFPIRSCSLEIPSRRKYRVCLDYFIGRCPGCCEEGKTTPDSYKEMIGEVILFLSGRSNEIANRLRARMKQLSEEMRYEEAARVRDQLRAIESVMQKQRVVSKDREDRDMVAVASQDDDACVVLMQVREGVLLGQKHYIVTTAGFETGDIVRNFLPRYYKTATVFPSEIVMPTRFEDMAIIADYLKEKAGRNVRLSVPQRGEKVALLKMAHDNARHHLDLYLAEKDAVRRKPPHVISSLARDLYLKNPPRTIAACDISNIGAENAVGSVVFFTDGKPKKSGYRRMKIKAIEGQDDFSMMKELVERYFNHLAENQMEYPDLLLIDGGKGQLNAARSALKEINQEDQQMASLAKRFEEIYLPGRKEPISIPKTSSSVRLLQRIRDEAHRFAVQYHRKLRSKKLEDSILDRIPGVGKKRKMDLLASFGSLEAIKEASYEQLLAAPHIPAPVARAVRDFFNPGDKND
jgi:excinuclease ABC subunit C